MTLRHICVSRFIDGNPCLVVGKWINNHRSEFPSTKTIVKYKDYYNGRLPVIASVNAYCSYWAKGDLLQLRYVYIYPYAWILNYMKEHNASVLIEDSALRKRCPEFKANYKKDFIVVRDFKNLNIKVLRLKNN